MRPQSIVIASAKATSNKVVEEYTKGKNGLGSFISGSAHIAKLFRRGTSDGPHWEPSRDWNRWNSRVRTAAVGRPIRTVPACPPRWGRFFEQAAKGFGSNRKSWFKSNILRSRPKAKCTPVFKRH